MFFAFRGEEADDPAVVGARSNTGRGGAEPAPYREDRMSQQTGRRVVGPYGSDTGGAQQRAVGGRRRAIGGAVLAEEAQRLLARVLASSMAFWRAASPS